MSMRSRLPLHARGWLPWMAVLLAGEPCSGRQAGGLRRQPSRPCCAWRWARRRSLRRLASPAWRSATARCSAPPWSMAPRWRCSRASPAPRRCISGQGGAHARPMPWRFCRRAGAACARKWLPCWRAYRVRAAARWARISSSKAASFPRTTTRVSPPWRSATRRCWISPAGSAGIAWCCWMYRWWSCRARACVNWVCAGTSRPSAACTPARSGTAVRPRWRRRPGRSRAPRQCGMQAGCWASMPCCRPGCRRWPSAAKPYCWRSRNCWPAAARPHRSRRAESCPTGRPTRKATARPCSNRMACPCR